MIGKNISHYRILEKLGEGGVGTVYKAQDTRLDRLVALKFLHPQFGIDEMEKKRFLQEARAAAGLDHPNICAVHEIDETEEGRMFIVMAYYEGETLRDRIGGRSKKPTPFSLDQAIGITLQVARGLQRAHQSHIVHRDIKSANIIITKTQEAKIVDFGLAKLKGHTKITKTGTFRGTITYMSPEQAQGEKIDQRTDIWSLGVVLYEMVTGRLPFSGTYDQAIIYSILNEEPEPVSAFVADAPTGLERIIEKSMEKSPEDRYQNMEEMIRELGKLKKLPGPGILSLGKSGFFKALKRLVKPIKIPTFIILALVVAIAGYLIFIRRSNLNKTAPDTRARTSTRKSIAILYFKNNTGDKNLDYLRSSLTDLLITDLAQSRFVRVLSEEQLLGILEKIHKPDARSFTTRDFQQIALQGNVDNLLVGKYNKIGEDIILNITLHDSQTGEIIGAESMNGKGIDSIYSLVDKLTRKIKTHFKMTSQEIDADIDLDIRDITTSSIDALRHFVRGTRLYNNGKFRDSIRELGKAVAIDPEFAMAYRYIAMNYSHLGIYDQRDFHLKNALQYLDRLTLKERYHIKAAIMEMTEQSQLKPIEIYRELLRNYPDDHEAMVWIGSVYRNLEEWDQALPWFQKAEQIHPSLITAINLAYIHICRENPEKALKLLKEKETVFKGSVMYHKYLAISHLYLNEWVLALDELAQAQQLAPDMGELTALLGHTLLMSGEPEKARPVYQELKEKKDPDAALQGYYAMAQYHLANGQFENCRKEILQGMALVQDPQHKVQQLDFLVFLAYLDFQQEKYESARETCQKILDQADPKLYISHILKAQELQGLVELNLNRIGSGIGKANSIKKLIGQSGFEKAQCSIHLLQGWKARLQNQSEKAIDELGKACALVSRIPVFKILYGPCFCQHTLALALAAHGQKDRAVEFYENIISQPLNLLTAGDIYVRSCCHLGKLYADQGNRRKAMENLEKFLGMWKHADPGIPEIREAKALLSRFKG